MIPANSRKDEPIDNADIGEEMHHCSYCGTRTQLMEMSQGEVVIFRQDCPHCGQRYHLHDAGAPEPQTDDEKFAADVVPLLNQLSAVCDKHNFCIMTAVALPPTPERSPLMLTVQPNRDGFVPNVFFEAAKAMGATPPATPPTHQPGHA